MKRLLVIGLCCLVCLEAKRGSSDSSSDSSSSSSSGEAEGGNSTQVTPLEPVLSTYGPNRMPLFRSLRETMALLESGEFKDKPEVLELLHMYEEKCVPDIPKAESTRKRRAFVAIESQFPAIRTSTTARIAEILDGVFIKIPPPCLVALRNSFEDNKILRRAYFSLSLYAAAHVARKAIRDKPAFVGGFWYDHAAFALSRKYGLENVPKRGSSEYKWPKDLLMPDVVFHINPLRRVIPRTLPTETPNIFKTRNLEIFKRFTKPPVIEINSTFLYKNIVTIIQSHMLDLFAGPKRINKDIVCD